MKLICYPTSGFSPAIRPAPATRDWMDATPSSFAYRCLPLNIANAHGWEILSPCEFTAVWDGDFREESIRIESDASTSLRPVSHFGSGILTFHIHALFRTEPGMSLFVTGPLNRAKDGIAPLSGIIETDWAPYTFTMNWRFTRPGVPVRFEKDEPFCFFFPVARGTLDQIEPEIRPIESDPDLHARYKAWTAGRDHFLKTLSIEGSEAHAEKWEKKYYRGKQPDGSEGSSSHQTRLRLKPFVDRTREEREGG